jgi:hypothetical protein
MKPTTMPGFTAEHSLYIGHIKYNSPRSADEKQALGTVVPQLPGLLCKRLEGNDVCCIFGDIFGIHGGYCILNGRFYASDV